LNEFKRFVERWVGIRKLESTFGKTG
jgi:hypothetical protein